MQTWTSTTSSYLLTWITMDITLAQVLEGFSDVLFVVFFFSRSPLGVLHVDYQEELLARDTMKFYFVKKKTKLNSLMYI